jgi:beta-galactosidase
MKRIILHFIVCLFCTQTINSQATKGREHISLNANWRFSLGHATDPTRDYEGTGAYLTKTQTEDGAAGKTFDDKYWQKVNLPHDWCMALPFSERSTLNRGYKAIGRNFPENSIGWYRKTINIPRTDSGKKISIEFEGIYRNSMVWINGYLLGIQASGYNSFTYDISAYVNYGEDNTISVRVDATIEEGLFYEGAGIYRNVWLNKTNPVHVTRNGTYITSFMEGADAYVTLKADIINELSYETTLSVLHEILDKEGKIVSTKQKDTIFIDGSDKKVIEINQVIKEAKLWSPDEPYLYKSRTIIKKNGEVIDTYVGNIGIRTIRFDANEGFFINDRKLKIVGSSLHQDHAGVGVGIPDGLHEYRINQLKSFGHNGILCSSNPPSPAFLDLCDEIGMLVIDENRLMGSNEYQLNNLEKMIVRDRNHPSVILWSIGRDEKVMASNKKGTEIAKTMQNVAKKLDPSRECTAAISGGWDQGPGQIMGVMGYNYISNGKIDEHHKKFPLQPSIGTEEYNTSSTRGIYVTNKDNTHLAQTNVMPGDMGLESGWKFYAERAFLSGLFFKSGIDYRGDSSSKKWPLINSQYGFFDSCGFPKDIAYFTRSWWNSTKPELHIATHWNYPATAKDSIIKVKVYTNCFKSELFLNQKSLGKKTLAINGSVEWEVKYEPGVLSAIGYKKGESAVTDKVETSGESANLELSAQKNTFIPDIQDVVVVKVAVKDKNNVFVPDAHNEISFNLSGPGKIIGLGNGDPSSHELDQAQESTVNAKILNLQEAPINFTEKKYPSFNDKMLWTKAFSEYENTEEWDKIPEKKVVMKGKIEVPDNYKSAQIILINKNILKNESVFINGKLIGFEKSGSSKTYKIDASVLKTGVNEYVITGIRGKNAPKAPLATDPGLLQIKFETPQYKRKVFNGLAQVIIQSTGEKGKINLTASSSGITSKTLTINVGK